MKKEFVHSDWLYKFMVKEGMETYNSLVLSNNIVSNGIVLGADFANPGIPDQTVIISWDGKNANCELEKK